MVDDSLDDDKKDRWSQGRRNPFRDTDDRTKGGVDKEKETGDGPGPTDGP